MKNTILIFLLLQICSSSILSQQIRYEKSLEKAQKLSVEKNKPLALIINMSMPQSSIPEGMRSTMLNQMEGLEDVKVAKKFNDHFIVYKVDLRPNDQDTALMTIIAKYRISRFPAFVFIDSRGGVIFKDFGASSTPEKYLVMLDKAIDASKQKSLVDYDNQYKSGNYDAEFLRKYIIKRRELDIINNAELIEKYVKFLKVADLDNYNEVLFILQAGPLCYGNAYKLTNLNKEIIDSIYKTELNSVRLTMNNAIISNSFSDAVATKSAAKANMVSAYVRGTWTNDYNEGSKQSSLKMIQFYQAIKDTNNYLRQASYFYDQYYMNISADSIKRLEAKKLQNIKDLTSRQVKQVAEIDTLKKNSSEIVSRKVQQTVFSVSSVSNYANELNSAAWSFYLTGTKNTSYLTKALYWSKRSIEITPIAAYHDTLAHILYLLGFYAEAESTQEKAIELAKQDKQDMKKFQDELLKIKNKTL